MIRRAAAGLLLAICSSVAAQSATPLRIGTITIETSEVYSADEITHGSLYRVADKLHVETRPSVVRGFLLFKEGDPYDPARLAETERNLRSLGFLKSVTVTESAPRDGYVDVVVRTQDAWSIDPTSEAGSKGGVRTFGLGFTDTNLAGFGRQVSVSYNKGTERSRAAIDYRDPSFFRPYWQSRFTWARNSDGFERRVAIGRPFYSFTTLWSTQLAFDDVRQNDHLYSAGHLADAFQQHHRQYVAAIGYALHPNEDHAFRITAGVRAVKDEFFRTNSRAAALPSDRSFNYLFARFERVDNDFLKMNYIDKDLRYQDFNLGQQVSAEFAVSPGAQGASTSEYVRLSQTFGRQIGDNNFVLPSVSFESRFDHGVQNAILSANARYIHRFDSALPQTFVARFLLNSGRNLDPDVQFFADGGSGLRGYRLHSFAGNRNFILNLEQRLFLGRETGADHADPACRRRCGRRPIHRKGIDGAGVRRGPRGNGRGRAVHGRHQHL